jgi:hypothetical protein
MMHPYIPTRKRTGAQMFKIHRYRFSIVRVNKTVT